MSDTQTSRPATEHSFRTSDGVDLFYRAWAPSEASQNAVVLFHRGHEHSGRWQDFVDRVNMADCWFFAWDARGHGRSPGERGYAESLGRMVRDAEEFVKHLSRERGIPVENMSVVAQSVGAVLAATWVHDYAPPIRALVLGTPALRVKLYFPFAITGLRLLKWIKPKSFIKSYVKPKLLTHDREQMRLYASDPLISPQIAVNILLDLYDTSTRLVADAGAMITPTLLLVSGNDWVVEIKPQRRLFERLSSTWKEMKTYPDFLHSTFWEKDRQLPIDRARTFLTQVFEQQVAMPSLLEADQSSYTQRVFDELACKLPIWSPKRWYFALQWLMLWTLGRLSRGVRIGWETGFDSGESLDHVYRNQAEGWLGVGKWIDRGYLDSPGWRGIRQRKVHAEEMIDIAIRQLSEQGKPIRILDIAAGPGRYVLDAIARNRDAHISATLCDRDLGGLAWGREIAKSMGIENVKYEPSDAFDPEAIASHEPSPTLGIVSGLYELFPSNEMVRRSLHGMGQVIEQGGFLIYTNQPWHPQQEMIARVLPNRDGDPWVMRCRTQPEMDQLVAEAGFEKIDMRIDDAGIFSVSLARKR